MHLLCLGLSHRTAPVALRERLHYTGEALTAALKQPVDRAVPERAILSTCNRLEVYAAARAEDFEPLVAWVEQTSGVLRAVFEPHLFRYAGSEAAHHLFRVAAGLDSLILGEPQILGQVGEAHQAARAQGAAGPVLSTLFRSAVRAGKRARTETAISRNPASVSSVAAKLAQNAVPNLKAAQVLIIGAGEMAELAVEALRSRGARRIAVISRTPERAGQLAARWGAQALTFANLVEALAAADIVITSTSAPHYIVTPDKACAALLRREPRPLVFIDIAVPRDVAPEVARLPHVQCYDIDRLKAQFDGAIAEREHEVPRVEAIIAEEVAAFEEEWRGLDVVPLITDLRSKADAIRRAEVEKALRRLPRLSEAERRQIEVLSQSLVNKLLHQPTRRLRAGSHVRDSAEYAAVIRHLFALGD
jgi:glutamyl-tRNA reductase